MTQALEISDQTIITQTQAIDSQVDHVFALYQKLDRAYPGSLKPYTLQDLWRLAVNGHLYHIENDKGLPVGTVSIRPIDPKRENGPVQGWLKKLSGFNRKGTTCEIGCLMADHDAGIQGLGKKLLQFATDQAQSQASQAFAKAHIKNQTAQVRFKDAGYSPVATTIRPISGDHLVILARAL